MKASTFLIMFGFLFTFGAVGGIEYAADDWSLLSAMFLALLGLSISYCGVLMAKVRGDFEDRTVDNPTLW
jgi:hypothetical protein